MTLDRLKAEKLARVTADFDGSVFMTRGHAEGTAVGYCKKKKVAAVIIHFSVPGAQTQQFLDLLHRPGTLRHRLIQRAGRLTKPEGKLTLTMSANRRSQSEFLSLLDAVRRVA